MYAKFKTALGRRYGSAAIALGRNSYYIRLRDLLKNHGYGIMAGGLLLAVLFRLEPLIIETILTRTLQSADDAYHALVSKTLAFQGVYGLPTSSETIDVFAPRMGTGPGLIIPGAVMMRIFGAEYWVPGATTNLLLWLQAVALYFILAPHFGRARALAYVCSVYLLIQILSGYQWYLPLYIGEAPAFGYLIIATALLATEAGTKRLAAAGFFFALAFLTKQITLFAAIGVVAAWLLASLKSLRFPDVARSAIILGLSGAILLAMFEAWKLLSLGFAGYADYWIRFMDAVSDRAVSESLTFQLRFETLAANLRNHYLLGVRAALFSLLAGGGYILALRRAGAAQMRFATMLWCAAATFAAYYVFVSTMAPRYLATGIYVFAAGAATPLLTARSWRPIAWGAAAYFVLFFGVNFDRGGYSTRPASNYEQHHIAAVIDQQPEARIVTHTWHSSAGILYLLKTKPQWVHHPYIGRFRGKEFLYVAQTAFTGKNNKLLHQVRTLCDPIPTGGDRYDFYRCSDEFWKARSKS